MRASFHVLTEGWIPVIDLENSRQKIGILDTLKNAHKLKEISDASPMVEYSLYRLLSVFLMDALRPGSVEDIEDLLERGSFDPQVIDDYISLCEFEGVSFDLFDPNRPFLQTPYQAQWDKVKKSVAELDYTIPHGNNHTHFDHRKGEKVSMNFDEAARFLLPAQLFCTAGMQGPSNVSASPPYYTVVKGRNLFETLVFSLSALNRIDIPFDDPPVLWRNTDVVEPKKEVTVTSWLFGMLFPARRITLIQGEEGVSEIYMCQGLNYVVKDSWNDPFVTYRVTKTGRVPWRPDHEKAVWRNLNDLVDVKNKKAPYVLRQYFELEKKSEEASITLYGVQTNRAEYLGVFHFDLKIPVLLTQDDDHIRCLTQCIEVSEQMADALSCSITGILEIPGNVVSQAVQSYYAHCEQNFWSFCNSISVKAVDLLMELVAWRDFSIQTAKRVREQVLADLHLSGHAMVKAAKREKMISIAAKSFQEVTCDGE